MEAKIYNLDEYRARKTARIKKEKGKDTANHPVRKVTRKDAIKRHYEVSDDASPYGIKRPVISDEEQE